MVLRDLDDYAVGVHLLGGGGGGVPWLMRAIVSNGDWPVRLWDIEELDPALPCIAAGFGGSTMLMAERLPGHHPYAPAIAAVERWTGTQAQAVCPLEIGGLNGLSALSLAADRVLVDADLMGRAFPGFDQLTLLVDGLVGLVLACGTGGDGVLIVADARPAEAERVLRAAFEGAGGWAPVVLGGFTVGDLEQHAIRGSLTRARELGATWRAGDRVDAELAQALGGRLVVHGRVRGVGTDRADWRRRTIDLEGNDGEIVRVVAGSEFRVVLVDGAVRAKTPDVIILADVLSGELASTDTVRPGHALAVLALPAPEFWESSPRRSAAVSAAYFGLAFPGGSR